MADWDSTKAAFDKVKAEVGEVVDVLINNAGITRDVVFRKMTRADWDAVIDTNLTSLFNVTRAGHRWHGRSWLGPHRQYLVGERAKGQFGQTNYSTAKAGLHVLPMALAQEVATKGVTVNTVSPGYIATGSGSSPSARTCWTRSSVPSRSSAWVSRRKSRIYLRTAVVGRIGLLHGVRTSRAERRCPHMG
ncbi:SDR family NAD(P)-dependent oxidoreductase [Cupriavidus basilensis]